jgi:hypothetical protein
VEDALGRRAKTLYLILEKRLNRILALATPIFCLLFVRLLWHNRKSHESQQMFEKIFPPSY